jgi:hypothetical protein
MMGVMDVESSDVVSFLISKKCKCGERAKNAKN